MTTKQDKYEKLCELGRRRGFFWSSSEIYGGVSGFIDYGPLGTLLKKNIEEKWREWFVKRHQDFIVEIETPVVMPAIVFEASGHVEHFTDYIVECSRCGRKYRADHLIEDLTGLTGLEGKTADELTEIIRKYGIKCPECGGEFGPVKKFNLLFKTTIGPYSDNIGYARPEAAQGMFVNFHRIYEMMDRRLPLGIAQIGKVLRNEISPRQGPIRLREFTIMELELFFDPQNPSCPLIDEVKDVKLRLLTCEDIREGKKEPREVTVKEAIEKKLIMTEWNAYFMALAKLFMEDLGIPHEKQMFIEKLPEERAHYAAQTFDQVVWTERWGWIEVSGHAYRTDYDLRRHMEYSKRDLRAYRRLSQPRIEKKLIVKPNIELIKKQFGENAKYILRDLSRLSRDEIVQRLNEVGYVEVQDVKLSREYFIIEEREEKIEVERFIPHVAEPSFGADRVTYVVLEYAYTEKNGRVVLRLPRDVAPIKVAVFPLVKKTEFVEKAREVYNMLKKYFYAMYDDGGTIGWRYVKADEIGVPIAITIDGQTLQDNTVTLRDRDTWTQIRVPIEKLPEVLMKYFSDKSISFSDLTKFT
ncbi:MAG: glycine--tRNA ligase [Thermoprotei archaeon]|nr:MAG: glycine--tRNA ligase [Thermoprotei archaeon]